MMVPGELKAKVLAVLVLYCRDVETAASWPTLCGMLHQVGQFRLGHCLVYDNSPQREKEPHLPEGTSLIWSPDNQGTAGAYAAAIDVAAAHDCDWLLFLDQDTELPADYLARAARTAISPGMSVLVPRIRHDDNLISPAVITVTGSIRPVADPASVPGMPTAISSGMIARREAIAAALPFPDALWLDYVDHWMFLAFSRGGTMPGLIDVDLSHDLSIRTPRLLSRDRLASILAAERIFYRELTWPARTLLPLRYLARAARFAIAGHFALASLTLRHCLLPVRPHD